MARRGNQETAIFLLNIGVTKRNAKNDIQFLEKTKTITQKLIEKKIFLSPKSSVGVLITGGTSGKYMEELCHLQICNWEMVEKVLVLKGTDNYTNWMYALEETVAYMKENMPPRGKYSKTIPIRKIIIITDFKADWETANCDVYRLTNELNSNNIQVLAIGKDEIDEEWDSQGASKSNLKELLEGISGRYVTLDFAGSDLSYYRPPPKKPWPWYSILELTSRIKIPIVAYVKVKEETKFPSWKRAKNDQKVVTEKQYLDRWRNSYTQQDMTKGYKYGHEFHAVTSVHEESMRYSSGPKSYRILAFTKTAFVLMDRWCKASTRVIFPSTNVVAKEFYSLVQAMAKKNLAAIVRKVHTNNMTPRMVALFPCISSDLPWCLVEVTLPYKEDIRLLTAPPMKAILKQATNEQNKAVEGLLDALQLNESESESDDIPSFLPGTVASPTIQHKWQMLSYRALNPGKPLPPMADYLKQALKLPSVEERCKEPLESIKSQFRIEKIVPKKKWQRKGESQEEVLSAKNDDSVNKDESVKTSAMNESNDEIPDAFMDDMSDINYDDLDTI